jgi:serine/threonine-protein kinase
MAADLFGIVGTVIASAYHVETVVAEGGFGVVYRARHGGFRAPVALKCLKVPQHLSPEYQARFLEQFRAEAELMFRLSAATSTVTRPLHVDVMTAPNGSFVPFMVLEWLEGETLDALIRAREAEHKRPFDVGEVIELLEPVAKALERAHHFKGPNGTESIAHCDLKPENVFVAQVGGEEVVKILDFGVAQVRGALTRVAKSGEVALFTPAYGAPEQWNPKQFGETGAYTDVWGLALTLAEALVGHPVVTGDHNMVRTQILDPKRRPTPRTHGAVVSDGVEAVFARALAVDPRDRPQDAGAFWRALTDAAGRAASQSRPSGPEIPDLVPLARRASKPEMAAVAAGPVSFDFDDGTAAGGASLDLDLPPDEKHPRRSLAPVSLARPAITAEIPLSEATTLVAEAPEINPREAPQPAGNSPSLAPVTPRPASRAEAAPGGTTDASRTSSPPVVRPTQPEVDERTLFQRLLPGLSLAGASILLTLLDRAYAASSGEVFSLGPLRTSWVAGALLLGGLGLCARELFAR